MGGLFLPNIIITRSAAASLSPWEPANRRSWAITSLQRCVYAVGVVVFKRLITLELAGWAEEHKARDKNTNPRGSGLTAGNCLVFTRNPKDADGECFLREIQFTRLLSQCVVKRMQLSRGYLVRSAWFSLASAAEPLLGTARWK